VVFNYDTGKALSGVVVRNDHEHPFLTIIRLHEGRFVMGTECMYCPVNQHCRGFFRSMLIVGTLALSAVLRLLVVLRLLLVFRNFIALRDAVHCMNCKFIGLFHAQRNLPSPAVSVPQIIASRSFDSEREWRNWYARQLIGVTKRGHSFCACKYRCYSGGAGY
jgi:hypothetical protein